MIVEAVSCNAQSLLVSAALISAAPRCGITLSGNQARLVGGRRVAVVPVRRDRGMRPGPRWLGGAAFGDDLIQQPASVAVPSRLTMGIAPGLHHGPRAIHVASMPGEGPPPGTPSSGAA